MKGSPSFNKHSDSPTAKKCIDSNDNIWTD